MKKARGWKMAALIPLILMGLVLLAFGLGEAVSGDLSGLAHLLPPVIAGLVAWLGWKRPAMAGWLLLAATLLQILPFTAPLLRLDWEELLAPFLILILPPALSGALFLAAARAETGHAWNAGLPTSD